MKVLANNVETTLTSGITAGATSITVQDGAAPNASFPNPSGGVGVATIMDTKVSPTKIEIITYTGVTDNLNGTHTLTGVTRAQEGTTGQSFSAGAYIAQFVTQQVLQDLQDAIDGKAASSHTHAASDVTSGAFADARISQSSVTQHQAALVVTESQISDLGAYLENLAGQTLGGIGDVTITAVASGELLMWNGSAWVNQTLAEAGVAAASHTHAASDITSGTFADARISQTSVTQHQAALTVTESQISDLGAYLTAITGESVGSLSDVTITAVTSGELLAWSGTAWINQTLAEAGVAAASHTHAAGDVVSGTFADARISQSSVTQHQAALAITESQISDLGAYLTDLTGQALSTLGDVTITAIADGELLRWNGTAWINNTLAEAGIAAASHTHAAADVTSGTFADARIAQSSVTQHQAALAITESQISDLGAYITGITAEPLGNLSDVTITTPATGNVLTYNGTGWVNQAGGGGASELSDLSDVTTTGEANYSSLLWDGSEYVNASSVVWGSGSTYSATTNIGTTDTIIPFFSPLDPRTGTGLSSSRFTYTGSWVSTQRFVAMVTVAAQESAASTAAGEFAVQVSANGSSWSDVLRIPFTMVANEKKPLTIVTHPFTSGTTNCYIRAVMKETSGSLQVTAESMTILLAYNTTSDV